MRTKVRDLILQCRRAVAAEVAKSAALSDTHALLRLDELLVADATNDIQSTEVVVDYMDDDDPAGDVDDDEHAGGNSRLADLQRELERERRAREQDSKLIEGLRKRLDGDPPTGGA